MMGDNSQLKILAWRSHFVDKQLTADAVAATTELDSAKRIALYQDMQRRFWDVAPFAMVLQKNEVATLRKGVDGLQIGPLPDFTIYRGITKG